MDLKLRGGGTRPAPNAENYLCRAPPFSGSTVVFVSAFVMVSIQFGKFLVCCSSASRAQPFVKAGAHAPMLYEVDTTVHILAAEQCLELLHASKYDPLTSRV